MIRLKIYSAHHLQPSYPSAHDIFIPIWGGGLPSAEGLYIVDDLVPRKPTLGYNETSQQYYVWKHLLSNTDYVGFEHYRRLILFPQIYNENSVSILDNTNILNIPENRWHATSNADDFERLLQIRRMASDQSIAELKEFIAGHDIILPRPHLTVSLEQQWFMCGCNQMDLEIFAKCIASTCFYKRTPFKIDFSIDRLYFCNIFVARSSLFSRYMELWEQVMFALQGSYDFSTRMPGTFSERLFAIYIDSQIRLGNINYVEIPFCLGAPKQTLEADPE